MFRAFLFFSFLVLGKAVMAQSNISNGYIKYNVTIESDLPVAALLSMGTTLEIAFKDQQTKAVAKTVGGTNTIQAIANYQTTKGISLLDIMSEKKAVKLGATEYQKAKESIALLANNPMRITESTKVIAGYTCKKILMKDKQTGASIILYVTDKIKPQGDILAQQLIKIVKGFPLRVIVRQENTIVHLTATTVTSQTPSERAFSQEIPSGYKITTVKELEATAQHRVKYKR